MVKIGALSDQSGLYADLGGPGSTLGGTDGSRGFRPGSGKGWKIDVISGDHLNKPDVGVSIAQASGSMSRRWTCDCRCAQFRGRAGRQQCRQRDKNGVLIDSAAGTSDLTNAQCTPNTVHWTFDTYMLAHGTGCCPDQGRRGQLVLPHRRLCLSAQPSSAIPPIGGDRPRAARFSAASSTRSAPRISRPSCCRRRPRRPRSSGLANAGADTTTAIKQAAEFGITRGAGRNWPRLLMFISDIHSLGLAIRHKGLNLTETFYWDMNDQKSRFLQALSRPG